MAEIEVGPDLADLEFAEGVVPMPVGDVSARVEREGRTIVARYRAPDGARVRPSPAPGLVLAAAPIRTGTELELRFAPAA
jgi:hypothetical protein